MAVGGVAPTNEGNAVVLMDDAEHRGLVLFVGGTEALSIALRLEQRRYERPLTHDLLDSVVRELGGDVVSVRVDRLENDIYFGSLLISKDGRLFELDARPSDALALAIGNSVPVFVAETVLAQAGIDVDRFDFRKLRHPPPEKKVSATGEEVEL
jgi:bifunctional DNase/RNase